MGIFDLAEMSEKKWKAAIGRLPSGFFIKIRGDVLGSDVLDLCYKGEGFKEISKPDGGLPEGDFAIVCSLNVEDDPGERKQEVASEIRREVERIQSLLE